MYKLGNTKIHISSLSLIEFTSVYNQHKPYIKAFEKEYHTSLLEIRECCERPTDPPMIELHYVFDDNFGGYTIDAVKKSLEEK